MYTIPPPPALSPEPGTGSGSCSADAEASASLPSSVTARQSPGPRHRHRYTHPTVSVHELNMLMQGSHSSYDNGEVQVDMQALTFAACSCRERSSSRNATSLILCFVPARRNSHFPPKSISLAGIKQQWRWLVSVGYKRRTTKKWQRVNRYSPFGVGAIVENAHCHASFHSHLHQQYPFKQVVAICDQMSVRTVVPPSVSQPSSSGPKFCTIIAILAC